MQQRKARRKLLYPGGLISLSVLPFLCFAFFQQHNLLQSPYRVLEVNYWNPKDTADDPAKYVNEKFNKIKLTGTAADRIKLDYAKVAIRELMLEQDSTLGIEFTFTNKAKYSSLVRLFEICEMEEVRAYVNHKDKFWVFNFPPKPKNAAVNYGFRCGNSYYDERMVSTEGPWTFMDQKQWILLCLSLIMFVVLIGLMIKESRKPFLPVKI